MGLFTTRQLLFKKNKKPKEEEASSFKIIFYEMEKKQ
jgi:hypothetical protein